MNIRKCWTGLLLGFLLTVPSMAAEFKSAKEAIEKGTALLDKGEYDKAIAAFDEAIRFNPRYATVYVARSRAYRLKGDRGKAHADWKEAESA